MSGRTLPPVRPRPSVASVETSLGRIQVPMSSQSPEQRQLTPLETGYSQQSQKDIIQHPPSEKSKKPKKLVVTETKFKAKVSSTSYESFVHLILTDVTEQERKYINFEKKLFTLKEKYGHIFPDRNTLADLSATFNNPSFLFLNKIASAMGYSSGDEIHMMSTVLMIYLASNNIHEWFHTLIAFSNDPSMHDADYRHFFAKYVKNIFHLKQPELQFLYHIAIYNTKTTALPVTFSHSDYPVELVEKLSIFSAELHMVRSIVNININNFRCKLFIEKRHEVDSEETQMLTAQKYFIHQKTLSSDYENAHYRQLFHSFLLTVTTESETS